MVATSMVFKIKEVNGRTHLVDLRDFECELKKDVVFIAVPGDFNGRDGLDNMLKFIREHKPKSVTIVPSDPESGIQIEVFKSVYQYGFGEDIF